jgi:hypothetical protein
MESLCLSVHVGTMYIYLCDSAYQIHIFPQLLLSNFIQHEGTPYNIHTTWQAMNGKGSLGWGDMIEVMPPVANS